MKVSVLSSGSKGNCTLIEEGDTRILVDLGVTKSYVESRLRELQVEPEEINAILITHTHVDHIQGLKFFLKKYKTTLYVNKIIYKILREQLEDFSYKIYEESSFDIDDLNIKVIKTSHDVKGSVGFIIKGKKESIVYITDTGYINNKYFELLKNHNLYVIESNHDVEMLMNGKYPFNLKKRILGNKGHLSNCDTAYYLSEFIGPRTTTVILAHVSLDNNTYEVALETVKQILASKNIKVNKYIVAKQKERTELIEV